MQDSTSEQDQDLTAIDMLQHVSGELHGILNAIDELNDQVSPELPYGKRELFSVICAGLYSKISDLTNCVSVVANDVAEQVSTTA